MINDIQLSIIIPTYNRSCYLMEAIDSVLAQTYEKYEILVIDDGSTDSTRESVKKYDGRVRYIYQENKGPSAARNNGIRNANGDLIAFLDSDDIWHADKLAQQVAAFYENPSLGIVATGYEVIDTKYQITSVNILNKEELKDIRNDHLYKNFFPTPTVMIKKKCFEKVGFFNEALHFAEDWEMWLRVMADFNFGYISKALTKVRVHPVSISTTSVSNNIIDWMKVIDFHSQNDSSLKGAILRRKRLSWLHLNHAVVHRGKNSNLERLFMIKSIISWPLWFPRRYSSLIKTLWRIKYSKTDLPVTNS